VAVVELYLVTNLTRGSWLMPEQLEALIRKLRRKQQPVVINILVRPVVTWTFYKKALLSLALTKSLPPLTPISKPMFLT
jgi:hypothetical protein